ncbi:hypothetical protein BC826DRAFT_189361 [Russula brevipes]|nr:hypothetical protein BC826DRAFT_189361 [Russula brevipes]
MEAQIEVEPRNEAAPVPLPVAANEVSEQLSKLFNPKGGFTHNKTHECTEKMWTMLTEEVNSYEESISSSQKDDANGVLVFTGLFSAIVALFAAESYKKLSPDSGDTTSALLEQISRQLAGFDNNTYPPFKASEPFSPTKAILCVNALWFLSLVISIGAAFYVMLVQQWVSRYTQMVRHLSRGQGRVRSSLFLSAQKYRMSRAIELTPLPLHISVFLFFTGLIIFLFTISNIIAAIVTVCVGVFGLAYLGLTVLPTIYDLCPYFTPMSDGWWYFWHIPLSCLASTLHRLFTKIHVLCVPYNPGQDMELRRQRILNNLSGRSENSSNKHRKCLTDGIRGCIVRCALEAPEDFDLQVLTWWLQRPAMAEMNNVQDLVANIPQATLIQLMEAPNVPGEKTFHDHLNELLISCDSDASGLDDDKRSRRLLVFLEAINRIAKVPFVAPRISTSHSLLSKVRRDFAPARRMKALLSSDDLAIRVTACSICALLTRPLLRRLQDGQLDESERAWLDQMSLPEATPDPSSSLNMLDRNTDTFVARVFSDEGVELSITQAASFADTLLLLMQAGSQNQIFPSRETFEGQLLHLIDRVESGTGIISSPHRLIVGGKLRALFIRFSSSHPTTTNIGYMGQ